MLTRWLRVSLPVPIVLLLTAIGACASGGGSAGGEDAPRRGSRNLIIQAELIDSPATNAYEAVQRLRSSWLNVRSGSAGSIQVHIDGRPVPGGLNVLNSIQINDVEEIRYRNGRDATTLYGTNYSNGVIEVKTRAR